MTVTWEAAASAVPVVRVRDVMKLLREIGIRDVRVEVVDEHAPDAPRIREAERHPASTP